MRYVIRLVGLVSGESSEDEARYVCRVPERAGGGRGFLATTSDAGRALAFPTAGDAFEFWHAGPASGFHAVIEVLPSPVRLTPFS